MLIFFTGKDKLKLAHSRGPCTRAKKKFFLQKIILDKKEANYREIFPFGDPLTYIKNYKKVNPRYASKFT